MIEAISGVTAYHHHAVHLPHDVTSPPRSPSIILPYEATPTPCYSPVTQRHMTTTLCTCHTTSIHYALYLSHNVNSPLRSARVIQRHITTTLCICHTTSLHHNALYMSSHTTLLYYDALDVSNETRSLPRFAAVTRSHITTTLSTCHTTSHDYHALNMPRKIICILCGIKLHREFLHTGVKHIK